MFGVALTALNPIKEWPNRPEKVQNLAYKASPYDRAFAMACLLHLKSSP